MTKQLREMIDAENKARGLSYGQAGYFTTFTKGFGQKDDLRIATMIGNGSGGVRGACIANVPSFRKYLAANQHVNGHFIRCYESPKGKSGDWDRWTVVYFDSPAVNRGGELFLECVGMSGHSGCTLGDHLGKMVMFADIPEYLQSIVRSDLAGVQKTDNSK